MPGITVIGPGRMGGALALALAAQEYTIDMIVYRSRRTATKLVPRLSPKPSFTTLGEINGIESEIVLITVQDDDVANVADKLAKKIAPRTAVFHTSGSLSSAVLLPLKEAGCSIASIHPLASISSSESASQRFRGAYFCLEGDQKAVRIGRRLVRDLGGRPFTIDPSAKAIYHAAAVTAAGHATALFDIAITLMMHTGLVRKTARSVLQPLLAGVAANLEHQDTAAALTGPFSRADVATFERHLACLTESATKGELIVYLELASRSLDLAEHRGINKAAIAKMRKMISLAKRDIEC